MTFKTTFYNTTQFNSIFALKRQNFEMVIQSKLCSKSTFEEFISYFFHSLTIGTAHISCKINYVNLARDVYFI